MATVAARLLANGNFISSNFDEVTNAPTTRFVSNTSGVFYTALDEITPIAIPLRQTTTGLIANGQFDEITTLP